jgi:predicted  nucleic acid-binding Zn-ribbon protein
VEALQKQIDSKQREINGLQRKLDNVHNEQKLRSDKSKLTIF